MKKIHFLELQKSLLKKIKKTQRLIGFTLMDQFKEDIDLGIVDSLSRKYKFVQVDLNDDSNREIWVGLTGPDICRSGGCTFLLLSHHGDIIPQFSVSKK